MPSVRAPATRTVAGQDFDCCPKPYPCDYTDENGTVLYRVARWQHHAGKSYAVYHPDHSGRWLPGRGGARCVLYRLPETQQGVARGDVVHVVEGERKVHLLLALGLAATCNDGGAGKFRSAHAAALAGARRVVVWADHDVPGGKHAEQVARLLHEAGIGDIRLPVLPGLSEGDGLDDWLSRQQPTMSHEQLRAALDVLVESAVRWQPTGRPAGNRFGGSRSVVTCLADVIPLPVEWLWVSRIPLGTLTVVDGDPGLGKSTMLLDLAARLSCGKPMPDDTPGPSESGTVILSAEDDLARVIRPRLDAAGADLHRVATMHVVDEAGERRDPTICSADLVRVEVAIAEVGAKLVIVDPLMAYLPEDVNANRDHDVRRALAALRGLAERTGVAVVVIRHLNKTFGHSPLYRGGGSIGIVAAARSGLMLAADPDDATGETRVLAVTKSNLAAPAPALRLRLVVDPGAEFPRVCWEGTSAHTAASLLAVPGDPEERSKMDDAVAFLRDVLASEPVRVREVEQEAGQAGISRETLRRARRHLGVKPEKVGRPGEQGYWLWRLPTDAPESHALAPPKEVNVRDPDPLRATDDGKPLSRTEDTEGGHVPENDPLRLSIFGDNGPASAASVSPTEPACPHCGGRVISSWGFGPVCTGCHRLLRAAGDGLDPRDAPDGDGSECAEVGHA